VQGLPSAVLHALTGHWIVAPWESNLQRTERWVRPFYEEEAAEDGTMVLIIARKASREPVEATLPPMRPVVIHEMEDEPAPEDGRLEPVMAVDPPIEEPEERVRIEEQFEEEDEAPPLSLPRFSAPTLRILMLLLALLSAVVGQAALSADPPDLKAAIPLLGLAILMVGAAAKFAIRNDSLPSISIGPTARRRWLAVAGLFFSFVAYSISKSASPASHPWIPIYLWIVAAALTIFALWPVQSADQQPAHPQTEQRSWEIPAVIALTTIALVIRLIDLTGHPYIINGSEASIGLDTLAAASGTLQNPFSAGWLTNPTLPLFILAFPLKLFGASTLGIRLLSPFIGAVTVPALYFSGRRWFGPPVALLASILLTGSHLHIHYSRLGLTNVWDPLLALLVFGLIYAAWLSGRRPTWLLAGLAVGLTPYLFTTAHLFPFMLPLILLALLLRRPYPPGYLRNLAAAGILALVVALPQFLFYRANDVVFMDRANTLGIFQSNWFVEEGTRTGQNSADILAQQFRQALFAFQSGQDTSNAYNPGRPLLSFAPAVFLTIGIGLALWRLRQLRYQLLLIWLGVTLFTAAFLIQSPPSSHRLLIAVPAVYLLIAVALGWLGQQLLTVLRLNRAYLLPALLTLALLMSFSDLVFYFGQYRSQHLFGDRNTEIAYQMAAYLNSLDGSWDGYFYGPPSMYTSFPTFPFLLADLNESLTFTDVVGGDPPQPPQGDTVYLFIPERAAELPTVQALYPNGRVLTFDGYHGSPLFYAYEIDQ
ncbi:MAG: glycosyltransferase family 39 protein, partial [Candidatus Promineifilaceae bacterium]